MSATFGLSPSGSQFRPLYLAMIAGLACALAIGKTLPLLSDAVATLAEPLCMANDAAGSSLDKVEPIGSYALPNVPGKRVTIVRVFYGPGASRGRPSMHGLCRLTSPRAK